MKVRELARHLRRYWLVAVLTTVYFLFGLLNHYPAGFGQPGGYFEFSWPIATSGDEPHYLVIVNSILADGDVRIDPDFARIEAGSPLGGVRWRGQRFGGHSILVDPRTGRHAMCADFCEQAHADLVGAPLGELQQYPAHPIGFPAFLALLLFPFRLSPERVEHGVGIIAILIAITGVILTYAAARKSGLAPNRARAAAALLGFATLWLPYVKSYFSESAIGVFILGGFVALRSRRPTVAGVMIAVAMSMKSLFLLFGFAWIAERVLRRSLREASLLTGSIGVCGLVLVAFNMATIRQPVTMGAGTFAFANGLTSLHDTFLHETQGLLLYVPCDRCARLGSDRVSSARSQPRRSDERRSSPPTDASAAPVRDELRDHRMGSGLLLRPALLGSAAALSRDLHYRFHLRRNEGAYALAVPIAASFVLAVAGGLQCIMLFSRKPLVAFFGMPG